MENSCQKYHVLYLAKRSMRSRETRRVDECWLVKSDTPPDIRGENKILNRTLIQYFRFYQIVENWPWKCKILLIIYFIYIARAEILIGSL